MHPPSDGEGILYRSGHRRQPAYDNGAAIGRDASEGCERMRGNCEADMHLFKWNCGFEVDSS